MKPEEFNRQCEDRRRALLAYAYTCSGNIHTAEDIVQETLLIACSKQKEYFPEADFLSWLISIARYVWLRECERKKKHNNAISALTEHATLLFDDSRYQNQLQETKLAALRNCLKKAPESGRELIRLHFEEKLKYDQIATRLNRQSGWVKMRMLRLRRQLLQCVRQTVGRMQA